MEALQAVVRNHPVIDNHAHNLLRYDRLNKQSFLSAVSEAQGAALEHSKSSLAHKRAIKYLARLFETSEDWSAILEKRAQVLAAGPDTLIQKCLKGVYTILIDDGLDTNDAIDIDEHNKYLQHTKSIPCRRIFRIEAEAEKICSSMQAGLANNSSWIRDFLAEFEALVRAACDDHTVVGFKSVIAYRTGLAILPGTSGPLASNDFSELLQTGAATGKYRVQNKKINEHLLIHALRVLNQYPEPKPIQFHTGLGDSDLQLDLADPAHLQPLIEAFPRVPIVLLHSSYPYTRNAGYLATVYPNVHLDLGLVFPMLSGDGQRAVLRQAIELTPGDKILYSSDGHWFAETYWLALEQFRDVLESELCDLVRKGHLSAAAATDLTRSILFENSNKLYQLGATAPEMASGKIVSSAASSQTDAGILQAFESEHVGLAFVYVQWIDRMGTMRARIVPIKEFRRLVQEGTKLGISLGNTGTLQNDTFTSAVNTCGQIYLKLAFSSLKPTHCLDTLRFRRNGGPQRPTATIMAGWCDSEGKDHYASPRGCLSRIIDSLKQEYGLKLTLGFEIEVVFLSPSIQQDGSDGYTPLTTNHAWGTLTPEQWQRLDIVRDIYDGLVDIGVDVQQMHAESGPGQFEFVLPPEPALQAVDTLYQARQVVAQIAQANGLRATLHPQPLPGVGSGAHAHVGLDPPDKDMDFWGGVVDRLEAILAFTLSEQESYKRVVDGCWTGGTWVAWGTQNRETPLRRVQPGRWEVRCLDGFANMYLALSAVFAAGLLGLRQGKGMTLKDCNANPSHLSAAQRHQFGIMRKLPTELRTSMRALEQDDALRMVIGVEMVEEYAAMKQVEQKMLYDMEEQQRHKFLVERY